MLNLTFRCNAIKMRQSCFSIDNKISLSHQYCATWNGYHIMKDYGMVNIVHELFYILKKLSKELRRYHKVKVHQTQILLMNHNDILRCDSNNGWQHISKIINDFTNNNIDLTLCVCNIKMLFLSSIKHLKLLAI